MSSSPSNVPAAVAAIAGAVGVPAAVIGLLEKWPLIAQYPEISIALWLTVVAVGYLAIRFGRIIVAELFDEPAQGLARSIRQSMSATLRPGRRGRYLRQLRVDARELDLRGVETRDAFGPLLHDIYVEVSLDRGWAAAQGERLAARWKPGQREPLDHFLTEQSSHPDSDHHVFIITGQPGSGKTALLRHTALERCTARPFRGDKLPVLLYLRDHVDAILADARNHSPTTDPGDDADETRPRSRAEAAKRLTIVDIAAAAPAMYGLSPSWLRWRMERGRCLVLLDGLDEVADIDARRVVAKWIHTQTRYFPNQYVITSRPRGFVDTELAAGVPLHMRAFTVAQTMSFLRNWYYAVESRAARDKGEKIRVRSDRKAADLHDHFRRRPGLYDLASRPLLLAMIANVHYFRRKLPGGRAELYREMCDMLLKRRPPDTGMVDGASRLSHTQQAMLIRKLALAMMERRVRSISRRDAHEIVSSGMARIPHPVPASMFCDEMIHNGLLIAGRHGDYEFPHTTIQEYLASAALHGSGAGDFLAQWVEDPWWYEVIKLWAATDDASVVVEACLESHSDTAIWLAFECAKDPHELDPRLRERLEQMRAEGNVPTLVKINDNLHEFVQLGEDVIMCARPVDDALYAEYLLDMAATGWQPAPDATIRPPSSNKPASGMWASDAQRLVNWVNQHTNDETTYRLPTVEEFEDPSISKVVNINRHPVWAHGGHHPRLYCRDSVRDTYSMPDARLHDYVLADRKKSSAYLIMALAFLRAASMPGDFKVNFDGSLRFAEVFAFARLIDHGQDPDPAVAKVTGRVLSWYNAMSHEPIVRSNIDVDAMLRGVTETDTVQQLCRLGVVPEVFGDREFTMMRAYLVMLVPWLRTASKVFGDRALPHLDAFMASQVSIPNGSTLGYPEDILSALRTAVEEMRAYRMVDPIAANLPPGLTSQLAGDAHDLVAPLLRRSVPYVTEDVRVARLGAVAGCVAVGNLTGMHDTAIALQRALRGLAVLQARVENDIIPIEILLLARA